MKEEYKIIDWKKERDKALDAMVAFRKLGDMRMADECLKLAAHINMIRTEIEPIKVASS